MDEMSAFERQLARVAREKVGPLPAADLGHVVQQAVQTARPPLVERLWRMGSLAAAAVVLVVFGGFLLASLIGDGSDEEPALAPSPSVSEAPATADDDVEARGLVVAQDGSGDYTDIADAVEAAVDGDTITIRPGTYAGAVIIDKHISIVGDGPRDAIVVRIAQHPEEESPWIRWAGPTPYAFWIQGGTSASVSISDVTVSAEGLAPCPAGEQGQDCAVAFAVDDGALALERVTVDFSGYPGSALRMQGDEVVVGDSSLDGAIIASSSLSQESGLSVGVLTMVGSELTGPIDAEYAEIRDSIITGKPDPRNADVSGLLTIRKRGLIEGNTIAVQPPALAIRVEAGGEAIIRDNEIQAGNGIRVEPGSPGSTVSFNSLDVTNVGIAIGEAETGADHNRVHGGRAGIEVFAGEPMISENQVTGSEVGVRARGSRTRVEAWCNDFTETDQEVVEQSGATVTILPVDLPDDCEFAALHLSRQGQ